MDAPEPSVRRVRSTGIIQLAFAVACLGAGCVGGVSTTAATVLPPPVALMARFDSQPEPKPEPKPAPRPAAKKGVLAVPEGIALTRDVEYATVNGRRLLLDIYLPEKSAPTQPVQPKPAAEKPASAPGNGPAAPTGEAPTKPGPFLLPEAHESAADGSTHGSGEAAAGLEAPLPVVIWVHGGGWETGTKDASPAARLVPYGYAAVSISYRFSQVAPYPAQIHDCKAAVRWVRAHAKEYNFDPDRIGVWGASAGGHLVALLGTTAGEQELEGDVGGNLEQSSAVQAVCDWFGPTDIIKLCRMASGENADEASQPRPDLVVPQRAQPEPKPGVQAEPPASPQGTAEPRKRPRIVTPAPIRKLFGGVLKDKLELAVLANPITFVDKSDAPVLIVHGDSDSLVPLDQSTLFKNALERSGVRVTLHVVKGGGHGFWNDELLGIVRTFFDETLRPVPAVKPVDQPPAAPASR